MAILPKFNTPDRIFSMLQTAWASKIDPVLQNPLINGRILKQVQLQTGTNQVNHGLQRALQGWFMVRQRSAGNVYDNQDNNTMPTLTLELVSDAVINVDIYVF